MEISLFLCGNSAEMREIMRGKTRGMETSVRNSVEMRETEGNSCTLTFVFMLA